VLADSFSKVRAYVGEALFDELAFAHIAANTPQTRNLAGYGEGFADLLAARYPLNPELSDLAHLEWAMRCVFDAADHPAWSCEAVAAVGAEACLQQWPVHHPSLQVLRLHSNAISIWQALHDDAEVPPAEHLGTPLPVAVWRRGWQPHFMSLDGDEATLLQALSTQSIEAACAALDEAGQLPEGDSLAAWLQRWWQQGLLLQTV
jgi:hypothetical protein